MKVQPKPAKIVEMSRLRLLLSVLRPFRALVNIAAELKMLRELYEAELGTRVPPIYRVTEQPNVRNTEVSYMGVADERKPWERWGAADEDDGEPQ